MIDAMRPLPTSPPRHRHSTTGLFIVSLVFIAGCSAVHATGSDRAVLTSMLYGHASEVVLYWANAGDVPPDVSYVLDRVADEIPSANVELGLFQIIYDSTDLPQFVVHIKGPGHSRVLVFNQGHAEPDPTSGAVAELLREAFADGYDLLLTSLPLVGLNAPDPNRADGYHMVTRGSEAPVLVDPTLLADRGSDHGIFDFIDDPDNFMHYFIDGTFLTSNIVTEVANPDGISDNYRGPIYDHVDYVGFSGGGAMGLISCAMKNEEPMHPDCWIRS